MGLYAEPKGNKAKWFAEQGIAWDQSTIPDGLMPVVMLRQGFIALGVAYNAWELARFQQSRPDGEWRLVPKALLREVVPSADRMKEFR